MSWILKNNADGEVIAVMNPPKTATKSVHRWISRWVHYPHYLDPENNTWERHAIRKAYNDILLKGGNHVHGDVESWHISHGDREYIHTVMTTEIDEYDPFNATIYCVVRNPWERLASAYRYYEERIFTDDPQQSPTFPWNALKTYNNFSEFLNDSAGANYVLKPQTDFYDLSQDIILRHEQLDSDFSGIKNKTGVDVPLPHINTYDSAAWTGSAKWEEWMYLYDSATVQLVATRYSQEISDFGYTWPGDQSLLG